MAKSQSFQLGSHMQSVPEWEVQRAQGLLMGRFATELKDEGLANLVCESLEPLVSRGLKDPIVECCLGDAYRQLNRNEEAEQHWRQALYLNPSYELALRNLSMAVHDAGRDAEAEALLARYLKSNRWDRTVLGRHIHVLARLQRIDEALREAEEAVLKFPADAQIRQWLADAYQALGRTDEAKTHRAVEERLAPTP